MAAVKFHKVTTLPGTLEADAIYFVQNSGYAEIYVTNSAGIAKSGGNSAMITAIANTLITAALADMNAIEIVANIAARDALVSGKLRNMLILVSDATGDSTVTSGAALYSWKEVGGTFTKLTEFESLDVTLQWSNIQNKPTSSVANIDDAVTKKHAHANITFLDKIGESGGSMTYNGSIVGAPVWSTTDW